MQGYIHKGALTFKNTEINGYIYGMDIYEGIHKGRIHTQKNTQMEKHINSKNIHIKKHRYVKID